MKRKFYFTEKFKVIFLAFIGMSVSLSVFAQEYADTTGLIADLEAGIYEEYVLAPASATDTFFLGDRINLKTSAIIKAKDDLGFKPVVTGNRLDAPSYFFYVEDVTGGLDVELQGIEFIGSIGDQKMVDNGSFKIYSENVNVTVKDCDFYDFPGYNTIAKYYAHGGNVTLDNVLIYNCAGKIVQVNYKVNDETLNYVPHMGDFTMTNCTFAKIYKRMFFELGGGDSPIDGGTLDTNAGADNVTIDHCTFYAHVDKNVMSGREKYHFAGDQSAIKGKLSITNTLFAAMDNNLNADSASQTIFDYNYLGFAVAEGVELEDFSIYGATNTVTTDPVFADVANGEWNLLGSDGTPIGDPRWWQGVWNKTSVKDAVIKNNLANIYSDINGVVVSSDEVLRGNVSVFNITGRLVYSDDIRTDRSEIQLPQGLYIVRLNTTKGNMAQKVLVNQ
ncbi:DUF5123 domain-containing protein [Bacteroidota bacterium]